MMARPHTKLSEAEGGDGNKCSRAWAVIGHIYKHCSSRIVVDGRESDACVVKHGPREGGVLSPILYAIFINEIAKEIGAARAGVAIGSAHVKVLECTRRRCDNK